VGSRQFSNPGAPGSAVGRDEVNTMTIHPFRSTFYFLSSPFSAKPPLSFLGEAVCPGPDYVTRA